MSLIVTTSKNYATSYGARWWSNLIYMYTSRRWNERKLRRGNLSLERDDRGSGSVNQDAAFTEAQEGPFDSEDDVTVNVGDGEVTVRNGYELPHNRQIHRVRCAVQWAYHGHRVPQRRVARCCHMHHCVRVNRSDTQRGETSPLVFSS